MVSVVVQSPLTTNNNNLTSTFTSTDTPSATITATATAHIANDNIENNVGDAPVQHAVIEPETWWGIPIPNYRKARLVKIVMRLALFSSLIEIIDFTRTVATTSESTYHEHLINFVLAISIPYCGYKGARDDDRSMLCWFCGCNLADFMWSILLVAYADMHVNRVKDVCANCSEQNNYDFNLLEDEQAPDAWTYEEADECLYTNSSSNNFSSDNCKDDNIRSLEDLKDKMYRKLIPLAMINLLTFYYGNKLYKADEKVDVGFRDMEVWNQEVRGGGGLDVAEVSRNNGGGVGGTEMIEGTNRPNLNLSTSTTTPSYPQQSTIASTATVPKPTYASLPFAGSARPVTLDSNSFNGHYDHNVSRLEGDAILTVVSIERPQPQQQQQQL